MLITPERAEKVVLASCALHNFMRNQMPAFTNHLLDAEDPTTHEVTPGAWRTDKVMTALAALKGNNASKAAKLQREYICDYINGVGAVPWQDRMIMG